MVLLDQSGPGISLCSYSYSHSVSAQQTPLLFLLAIPKQTRNLSLCSLFATATSKQGQLTLSLVSDPSVGNSAAVDPPVADSTVIDPSDADSAVLDPTL